MKMVIWPLPTMIHSINFNTLLAKNYPGTSTIHNIHFESKGKLILIFLLIQRKEFITALSRVKNRSIANNILPLHQFHDTKICLSQFCSYQDRYVKKSVLIICMQKIKIFQKYNSNLKGFNSIKGNNNKTSPSIFLIN